MRLPSSYHLFVLSLLVALPAITVIPLVASPQTASAPTVPPKRIVVSIVSVDVEHKAIQVKEIPSVIVYTTDTVFDDDVRPSNLKPGSRLQVVGSELPDGRILASEMHAAQPKS